MMDSNSPFLPHCNSDTKNAFRKPSGDAANRNYRRRSPVEGSPSPDASPRHGHSSSPNLVRENSARVSHHSRKYDDREQDQQYGRNHYGRSSDSLRHSDRQSFKSSYGHSRHDKYANEDRYREKLLSRSGHETRDDHMRDESDSRSKNYQRSVEKYSHDKYDRSDHRSKEKRRETYLEHQKYKDMDSSYDKSASSKRHALYDEVEREGHSRDWDGRNERRDSRRSSGDYRSDQAVCYSESRNQRDESGPQRDCGKSSLKEGYKSEQKESNDQNLPWEEKRKHDDTETGKGKDWKTRQASEQCGIEDKESSGKKLKLFDLDKDDNYRKDADESKTSSSKLSHESKADVRAAKTSGFDGDNDLDAAKVAAMRAAELVNRNLVGAGCLTTDQKKKLLWGGKRSTPTEESGHRWDTAMFSDRERQEKFNKLMFLHKLTQFESEVVLVPMANCRV
ncbi:arginine/serine-rich coiled-coil protein 2-like isoform X3 [Glycine soja]|uniref:arginine/serine-rich coiled-coil protein 2 isoform X3 n=1 Tax=Glycine max TaxID=3847 RepID=UPI00071915F3|nr:arginine/serine-rich coiled-coil protein 2 isoform X3 [Glycine max]XP_028208443.1 arginine/serine-rich coiled-coil protein 2-like isoform X3 [Glycine soja]|eukprot:XP_014623222.1 arginine/serine-rich coiled-coil protein 2 isoform X3 [Glycine max]